MDLKHLALLRHAKSSWNDPDLDDHERPLNSRGRSSATRIGLHIRDQGILPDLVLCSSALRTRQTLELLDLGAAAAVLVEDGLYGASAAELMARLRRVDPAVRSVLLVGHNPAIQDLAISLAGDQEQLASFPTAALADLQLSIPSWQDLRPGIATLAGFVTARELD